MTGDQVQINKEMSYHHELLHGVVVREPYRKNILDPYVYSEMLRWKGKKTPYIISIDGTLYGQDVSKKNFEDIEPKRIFVRGE